jgi:ribosomal protein S18 acetylase RimI-like enzyme
MIEYKKLEQKYFQEALKLAIIEYQNECEKCPQLIQSGMEHKLEEVIVELCKNQYGKVAIEDGKVIGYLAFRGPWEGFLGKTKGVFSPLGGSAFASDNRNMLASKLFQEVSSELVAEGICGYALSIYAHDGEVGKSFIMNGFGIRCSDAIMCLTNRAPICEIDKNLEFCELINEEKLQIEKLRKELVLHLCNAPTFFPTDVQRFDEWFKKNEIRVFAVKENNSIIGYMSLDIDAETFVTESNNMYNICGAYVDEKYRNMGIAKQLLEYVCRICEKEGMEYLGVDCETLNPTALRFWSKYFEIYTYSYARRIDERVVGYDKYLEGKWKKL